jgi:drug/metabolite transporter (DMT)-like permease
MFPRIQVLIATLLWSTSGAAVKLSILSGWQLSAGRSAVAAAMLALVLPGARRLPSRRGWKVALAYAATVVLYMLANRRTTAANAIFLQDTAPLYVLMLSSFLLRERPSRGELAAVPLFLAGLALFFFDQLAPGQMTGNVLAIASGICFAMTTIGLKAAKDEGDAVLVWGNLIASVASLPVALTGPSPRLADVGIVLFLGAIQLAIPYALFYRALTRMPVVEASLLVLLEPVLNPIWTFLLAGERPGHWAMVGGGLILVGTIWRTLVSAKASPTAPSSVPAEEKPGGAAS